MSDKEAGWYPDPAGENRQRYWDGDSWTEYYAPILPVKEEVHGARTAAEDYPYLVDAHAGAHSGVMVPPGAQGSGWPAAPGWSGAAAGRGRDGDTKEFTSGKGRSAGGVVAMIVASILVVGLVGGVGWWIATGGNDPATPPTGPTAGQTGTGTGGPGGAQVAGQVDVSGSVDGAVPAGGTWVGDLELDDDTTLILDARASTGGPDLVLDVLDEAGTSVSSNDDRGRELEVLGGASLDPVVLAPLPAGSYQVVVSEHEGLEASFTLSASVVSQELVFGETTTVELEEGAPWVGTVELPADGAYTFDVRDTGGGDPAIITRAPDGRVLSQDDRDLDADDYDPLLQEFFTAGVHVVVISEWDADATTVTVTVTETPQDT